MRKIFKSVAFAVMTVLSVSAANATECNRYDDLSDKQKYTLKRAFLYGAADDLGYTLAAIALQESNAGAWRVNFRSNDYGLMQINYLTAINTMGVTNPYRQMELIERIIYDDNLSLAIAISVLTHFQQNRAMANDVWREMVMRYNVGWQDTNGRGENYLAAISKNINMLQSCTSWGELDV